MKATFTMAVAILWLGMARNGWGQSDRLYPLFELTDEDVARIDVTDGSVEDWLEVVGEPTLTASDFDRHSPSDNGRIPHDPANLDFRLWLGWHQTTRHLYVAMERADDVYINQYDRSQLGTNEIWKGIIDYHDSSIVFVVDGDHSGGQFGGYADLEEEERLLLANQQVQWYKAIGEIYGEGSHVQLFPQDQYEDWFLNPPYADGGGRVYGENPTLSVTEFYVTPFDRFIWNSPEESVVSELYPGKVIGLWIEIQDWDGSPGPGEPTSLYWMPLTGKTFLLDNYDYLPNFLLLGPGGELPEGSVVESVSWGRIKASLGR